MQQKGTEIICYSAVTAMWGVDLILGLLLYDLKVIPEVAQVPACKTTLVSRSSTGVKNGSNHEANEISIHNTPWPLSWNKILSFFSKNVLKRKTDSPNTYALKCYIDGSLCAMSVYLGTKDRRRGTSLDLHALSFFLSPPLSISFSLGAMTTKLCLKFYVLTLKCGSRIFWIPFSIK